MRVAALHLYPVKSCAALSPRATAVDALGLVGDRRYALLGASGRALTQRDCPPMATIRPALVPGVLRLDLGGIAEIEAAAGSFSAACEADVWGRRIPARAAPAALNAQLSGFLGIEARLVELGADAGRSFADSRPVLVVSTGSLDALNAALGRAVGMERFRGNIVVEEAVPLAELGWHRLRAGEVELEFAEACERCEVTTIDQASGERRGAEPLQTLAARFNSVFGAHYRVARPGRIELGAELLPS
jgi:uncharacterized protein YcbX